MKNFIKKNMLDLLLTTFGTLILMLILGFDRPKGTIGVEIFFPFILALYWICKYIESKGE